MRISDWSSDVCSSDLDGCRGDTVYYCQLVLDRGHEELVLPPRAIAADEAVGAYPFPWRGNLLSTITLLMRRDLAARVRLTEGLLIHQDVDFCLRLRSGERRVGKVVGSQGGFRGRL